MHEKAVEFIISEQAALVLAFIAFALSLTYLLDIFLITNGRRAALRREGLIVRSINWAFFAVVFLLFGRIIPLKELETWRAAARIALFSLMISEIAFEITTMIPELKRMLWKKETSY